MATTQMSEAASPGPRLQSWFDHLEKSLRAEGQQAGLFEHSTMIGNAREFLVQRVLRSILPPMVHIGSGKVFDSHGNTSNQIDIVLFDSRFPVFEIDRGIGIYPIEGVIGTVEVKSSLSGKHLAEALTNAKSVIDLSPHMEPSRFDEKGVLDRDIELMQREGLSPVEARRRSMWEIIPATYVFSYTTKLRMKGLATAIEKWFANQGWPAVSNNRCPVLPRLIVAGDTISLLDDGSIIIDPGDDVWEKLKAAHGADVRLAMGCWNTPRPFGIFACHVIQAVCKRFGLQHVTSGVRYDVAQHLPLAAYVEADMASKLAYYVPWPQSCY